LRHALAEAGEGVGIARCSTVDVREQRTPVLDTGEVAPYLTLDHIQTGLGGLPDLAGRRRMARVVDQHDDRHAVLRDASTGP
jgi:hypothetical protein